MRARPTGALSGSRPDPCGAGVWIIVSDADEASNLELSRRRAAAVRTMLAAEIGIDAARMGTDGRGESRPAESNDTAAGKANIRRVEFVKL
jgi:OOP family OmpA-OmpF porin